MKYLVLAAFIPSIATAGIDAVIDEHILPAHEAFTVATEELAIAAQADCRAEAVAPAYHEAFDAWMGVSHISFGPIETLGLAPAIAYWPDTKNSTGRHLDRLISVEDPIVEDVETFANVSVAARGFFALERLLYEEKYTGYEKGSYVCHLVQAISQDLATLAATLDAEWQDNFAQTLRTGGASGNETYFTEREALQAVFTSVVTGLEFNKDKRLGRPLGTFERPRPTRAEARRSGRSLRNVTLSLIALRDLNDALTDGAATQTQAAFDRAITHAETLDDPVFAGVADPSSRLKVEILQQAVTATGEAVRIEVGPMLGVSAGFNALDGD
ncbi:MULTISPECIES: imelysin family protein [Halocynthiibacter]|uniref:Imelysin family protein n=1 Tax=Halocynthiibacter halioticoli TaxID=2986804 RepID=A0AAE3J0H7_9RHOB|nr:MULTISPECIES: imelysin family protein [Halocynthiibacter]MCV6824273.1 imelysin family protein [Halocynthiibacter halioticoli]MCW4057274.1 imelysin family protein [Halocynthiibacter sp. SDUM655004]